MEKLVQEVENCSVEKQVQLVEKCLRLVLLDETISDFAWLLLAKLVEKCTPQNLRAVQSRLAKKLVDIADNPTVHSGIFLRSLLIRNPQIGELHGVTIERALSKFGDIVIAGNDPSSISWRLAVELFSVRFSASHVERILNTLRPLLNKALVTVDNSTKLHFNAFALPNLRPTLITFLFDLLQSAFSHAKTSEAVPQSELFSVIEMGLNESSTRKSALKCVSVLCASAGKSILPFIGHIVALLVSLLSDPSPELLDTMSDISDEFGASSLLFKHYFVIFSALKRPLYAQSYGMASARLFSSILQSSAFLIKPEVLISVQRSICEQIIQNPSAPAHIRFMEAFVATSHELVPIPVQLARYVCSRASPQESFNLRRLCDVIVRPKIHNLSSLSLEENTRSTSRSIETLMAGINTADSVKKEAMENQLSSSALDFEVTETREEDGADDDPIGVVQTSLLSVVQTVNVVSSPTEEKQKRSVPAESTSCSPKKRKRKTNSISEAPSCSLKEGEASVEEIMNSFCPL